MTRIKLVALDLDGTVLSTKHELSEKTKTVLRRLSDNGVIIVIATGRSPPCLTKYFATMELSQSTWPGVSYNGACGIVWSAQLCSDGSRTQDNIFLDSVPAERALQIISFAEETGSVAQYYNPVLGEAFAVPTTAEHHVLLKRYAELVSRPQILVNHYEEAIVLSPAAKVLVLSDEAHLVVEKAKQKFSSEEFNIFIGSPDPYFIEFLHPEVSKGSGLVKLCAHLNIDIHEVVAFGDGNNDKEMLTVAGIGVAMQNATPTAKEAANVVLEWTNDEDGVARYLEHMEAEGYFGTTSV